MRPRRLISILLSALLWGQDVKFEASSQLVVVNVTVRGRDGKPVAGLSKGDFRILEDGKAVELSVFEFQELKGETLPAIPVPPVQPLEPLTPEATEAAAKPDYSNKRLLVLYFDFSSLPQTDQIRAKDAAVSFISKQMTASDLVAIYTYSTRLKKVANFTADRDLLLQTVQSFGVASGIEVDPAVAEVAEGVEEDTTIADETEFAIFNTDQKLGALEDLSRELAPIPEKKIVVYLSSGVGRNGMDNQAQMQSAVNAAVRSGVSFYPIDVRGLIAMAPAGDASQSAPRGTGVFSGTQQTRTRDRVANQQETLFALAADTGGKALLDSNDLAMGIRQAQRDTESYYTLAYYSTNTAKDGRFRKIKVELASARRDVKLEYRPGYYADKVWKQFDNSDKEKQLSEAMGMGNPTTELPLAVELLYFRLEKNRYYVPVAIKIPGSKLQVKSGKTELDFLGTVKDARGRTMATLRDTIKIKLPEGASEKLAQKSLLYDAAFQLTPGEFTIKLLARENQEGKLGTFEAKFSIPDLDQPGVAPVSSVLLGTGREPITAAVGSAGQSKKQMAQNPLISNGKKLTPSVTHVFRRQQSLTVYGEAYTPNAMARLTLYTGKQRIWESANLKPAAGRPGVFSVEANVPLKGLKPGDYICQLTVVDPAAQRFEVRRIPLSIVP